MKTLFIALRTIFYLIGAAVIWGWLALAVRPTDKDLGIENIQREIQPQKPLAFSLLTSIPGFRKACYSFSS
jgi:hypothetical protein